MNEPRGFIAPRFFRGFDVLPQLTTPLHIAAKNGRLETVSRLLSQGADVNQSVTDRGLTPLHLASALSSLEMVKILVDAGADVNFRDTGNGTPLMIACYVGRESVGRYLMEKGAEVNARSHDGLTPLMHALGSNPRSAAFISDLLRAGACVNDRDDLGTTLLHAVVGRVERYEDKLKTLRLLLTYPCDIDAAEEDGTTALHLAVRSDDSRAALMLIKAGCKLDIEDRLANSPLSYAILYKKHHLLDMLLAAGARVSRSDLLKVEALCASIDPTWWEHVLALCAECPSLSGMCRRSFYDHYGTEARNRIEKLPLPPLIKKFLCFEIL